MKLLKMKVLKLQISLVIAILGTNFIVNNINMCGFSQNSVKAMEACEEDNSKGELNKPGLSEKETKKVPTDKTDRFSNEELIKFFGNSLVERRKNLLPHDNICFTYSEIKNLNNLVEDYKNDKEESKLSAAEKKQELLNKFKVRLYYVFCGIAEEVVNLEKKPDNSEKIFIAQDNLEIFNISDYMKEYDKVARCRILNLTKDKKSSTYDYERFNDEKYLKDFYIKTLGLIDKLKEFKCDLYKIIETLEKFCSDCFFEKLKFAAESFNKYLEGFISIIEDIKARIAFLFRENKIDISNEYKQKTTPNECSIKLNYLLKENKNLTIRTKPEQEVDKDCGVVKNSKTSVVGGLGEKQEYSDNVINEESKTKDYGNKGNIANRNIPEIRLRARWREKGGFYGKLRYCMDVFYPVQYGDIFDADFGEYYEFFTGRLDVPLKSYDFICDNVEIVRNLIDSVYKSFENDGLGSPAPKYLPKFLKQCTEILNLEQNELKNYKDIYNPIRREIYCENLKRKESKLKKLEEDRLNLEKIEIEALDEILKFFNIDEKCKRFRITSSRKGFVCFKF